MGLTTSEIAVNTIPSCCCSEDENDRKEIDDGIQDKFKKNGGNNDDGNLLVPPSPSTTHDDDDDDRDIEDSEDMDGFMADPQDPNTTKVIRNINTDTLRYDHDDNDLWELLDRVFGAHQSKKILNEEIKNEEDGIKAVFKRIFDEYTKHELFESVINTIKHRADHPFDIEKTMSIKDYDSNSNFYEIEQLPFYEDKQYGIITNEQESDKVYRYKCIDGNTANNEYRSMECDDDKRHVNFPSYNLGEEHYYFLQLQYLSCGNISSMYYKTRENYNKYGWCFDYQHERIEDEDPDEECTLIAFGSFGQHYTMQYRDNSKSPINGYNSSDKQRKNKLVNDTKYINDVSYLQRYPVRDGYHIYGATAYFDGNLKCIAIQTYWDKRIWVKPGIQSNQRYIEDWKYAKWIWKISVMISSHLTEWIARCRFIEINSFIQSVQKNLDRDHVIRRLFKPFMYGTVSANNHFVELIKRYGLYHRVFGFEYKSFCNLLNDAMKTYRFKILKKKFKKLSKLNDLQSPANSDFVKFWKIIQDFVSKYFQIYYGPQPKKDGNDKIRNDYALQSFYKEISKLLKIDEKFRYKRFNVIMLITHFICSVTIYNKHLNEPFSFDGIFKAQLFYPKSTFSIQSYGGCAIRKNNNKSINLNCAENDILSFAEYILVILNNGIKEKNFDLKNIWSLLLPEKFTQKALKLFISTQNNLLNLEIQIQEKNKHRKIPYTACCVTQLQSSACL